MGALCTDKSDEHEKYQKRMENIVLRKQRGENEKEINQKRKRSADIFMETSPAKRQKLSLSERENALRMKLCGKTVSELQVMLEMNEQKKGGKKEEVLERVIDGIINGAIPKCPKCAKEGRGNKSFLKYDAETGFYQCSGGFDVRLNKRMPCDFY